MNIFFVDRNPLKAAQALPDRHICKMPVEGVQMLVSALLRHGVQPNVVTKAGTIHKGGYVNHPCTLWAGTNRSNAGWLFDHTRALCEEYRLRYGKRHFAEGQLDTIAQYLCRLPHGGITPMPLAMPEECKVADPVESYRNCIRLKVATKPGSFVWARGRPQPAWL